MEKEKNANPDAIVIVHVDVVPIGKNAKMKDIGTQTFKVPIGSEDLPIRIVVEPEQENEALRSRGVWLAETICKD